MNRVAKMISAYRAENELTLEEFGGKIGVGKSTVKKWESGNVENIRRDKLIKIADVLGVTPTYLMGWDDNKGVADTDTLASETEHDTNIDNLVQKFMVNPKSDNGFLDMFEESFFPEPNVYMNPNIAPRFEKLNSKNKDLVTQYIYKLSKNQEKEETEAEIDRLKSALKKKEADLERMSADLRKILEDDKLNNE